MLDYIYRPKKSQIIVYKNLKIIDLNETAKYIFELLSQNITLSELCVNFSNKFDYSYEESKSFILDLQNQFYELGIVPNIKNFEDVKLQLNIPIIHIIRDCNSKCIMCDCWKFKKNDFIPLDKLRPLFDKIKELNGKGVMISGGEPLMHPEIINICEYIKSINLEVYLNTNGFLIDKFLIDIKKLKIEEVVISFDGLDEIEYKTIRGVNFFNKIIENSKKIKEFYPDVRLIYRITLTRFTLLNLEEMIEVLINSQADHFGFNPLDIDSSCFSREKQSTLDRNNLITSLMPTLKELDDLKLFLKSNIKLKNNLNKLYEEGIFAWDFRNFLRCVDYYRQLYLGFKMKFNSSACIFPINSFVLDYDGSLKSCFYSNSFGSLYDFKSINWDLNDRLNELEMENKCANCRGKLFCDIGDIE